MPEMPPLTERSSSQHIIRDFVSTNYNPKFWPWLQKSRTGPSSGSGVLPGPSADQGPQAAAGSGGPQAAAGSGGPQAAAGSDSGVLPSRKCDIKVAGEFNYQCGFRVAHW